MYVDSIGLDIFRFKVINPREHRKEMYFQRGDVLLWQIFDVDYVFPFM